MESVKPFSGLENFYSPSEAAVSAVPKEGSSPLVCLQRCGTPEPADP